MRILRLAQHIVHPKLVQYSKNNSGYGRSVWDISRYSAQSGNQEYLYTYKNKQETVSDSVILVDARKFNSIVNLNVKYIFHSLGKFKNIINLSGYKLRTKFAYIYYNTTYGYIVNLIKKVKPDIIHIHGLTYATDAFVQAAIESKIPVVITLHGLNMHVAKNKIEKLYEINQIEKLNNLDIPITILSSGMLESISNNCSVDLDKIRIINHGVDPRSFNLNQDVSLLKGKYGITKKKVILSVGSLIERKNHLALINAIHILPQSIKDNIVVYIAGEGPMRKILENEIINFGLQDHVFLLGIKNNEELSELYSISNMTIMLSTNEGFGRPILESYIFGVPVIISDNFDALKDLYSENSMFIVSNRTPKAVASKIVEVLNSNINKKDIENFSKSKTWDYAISQYNNLYLEMKS